MEDKKIRVKPIPEYKKELVEELKKKIEKSPSILIVSIKSLPSSQFQEIKKSLRGKAEIIVTKKSIVNRALESFGKGNLLSFKSYIGADIALIFSDIDVFELSLLLAENQSAAKAKIGDLSPEDIEIEPGPTDLMPGPAISELGSVGLKIVVENGKLAIKKGAVIVKKGEEINDKVANVLAKLDIKPMLVGFIPIAGYDAKEDKIYEDIKIDKKRTLESLRESISKGLGFAVNIEYIAKDTIIYFISKAGIQEMALASKLGSGEDVKEEEDKGGDSDVKEGKEEDDKSGEEEDGDSEGKEERKTDDTKKAKI